MGRASMNLIRDTYRVPRNTQDRACRVSLARFLRYVLSIAVCLLLSGAVLFAQQSKPSEYQVKATYLYNFGKFVKWPARTGDSKDAPFTICVLGQNPFGSTLDAILAGETIEGKSVVARRISKPQDAVNCHILFISASESDHLEAIFAALDKANVLTVSDIPHFSSRSGMIQFVLDGDKVRFEVNLASAENAGLILSSELLKVATSVTKNTQPGD